ncbi:MAG: hypothetical protein AAF196_18660 [Planctomycetota bacterium]
MPLRSLLPILPLPALAALLLVMGGCFDRAGEVGRIRQVPSFSEAGDLEGCASYDGLWEVVDTRSSSGTVTILPVGAEIWIENGRLTTPVLPSEDLIAESGAMERRVDFLTNAVDDDGILRYRLGETLQGQDLGVSPTGEPWTTLHRSVTLVAGVVIADEEDEPSVEDAVLRVAPAPDYEQLSGRGGEVSDGSFSDLKSSRIEARIQVQTIAFEYDSIRPHTLVDDRLVLTLRLVEHDLQAR